MFKALISSLLGRTESVRTRPKGEVATVANASAVGIPESTLANPGVLPPGPPTQGAEPARRPSILSSYSPMGLTDNPLAIGEVRQTGPVTWIPALQGWCVNPSTSFPLTVVDSDEETACHIREALDGLVDHYSDDVTEAVAGLVVERGVRFHEFEEYLGAQRQTYRAALATARGERTGRARRQDGEVEEEVEGEALDALDRCCHDFEMLIEGEYPNDPAEIAAFRSFGFGNLLRYLGTGPANVQLIPPGHRRRIGFEALAQVGLAIGAERISEIPTGALLHAMTFKEIQSLSSRPIPSKLRRKNLAVEFLLGQDGIRERAIAATSLDAVFFLVPQPGALADLDVGGMHERMSFAWNATNLVVMTYLTTALAPTNKEYEGKHLAADRFKAHNVCDILTCRSCRKTHGESRPLAEWDRFPFHFGCRCFLLIEAR
jgi:hypothetical protein